MKKKALYTIGLTAAMSGAVTMMVFAGQGELKNEAFQEWIDHSQYVGSGEKLFANAETADSPAGPIDPAPPAVPVSPAAPIPPAAVSGPGGTEPVGPGRGGYSGSWWYDQNSGLSEGDRAGYHYGEHYWQYPENKSTERVQEQYARIETNPCSETAVQEMSWVEIPVWRLKNGQKVSDTARLQVMDSIADEVKEIFTEIYHGPEQFPVNSISGYSWRGNGLGSNHSVGLAIDINPDQNPQVKADGTVIVGAKWEPGVNPYSIGRDSDVVKAFGKHGWIWGATFHTKDYMHFDFYY